MSLPNPGQAVVELRKLSHYCLSFSHARGRHKARVFAASLGLTSAHAEELKDAILAAVGRSEATTAGSDEFGARFTLDFTMRRGDRAATVRTVWIVRRGEQFPRLTTCFVL